jgi:multiple sugar transport system substrate-binding protein
MSARDPGATGFGRRAFLRAAGVTAVGGALALGATGCRGLVPHTSGDDAKTLSISWWAEGTLSKLHVDVVREFERQHPGITVQPQYQALNGYDDKLSTQISGGNQPDVFMLRRATFADYISRGVVRQLDDLVPGTLPFEQLPETLRSAAQYKGHWYAIPLGVASSPALIANRTMLEGFGATIPPTDWVMADFERLMRDVVQQSGGRVYGANDMAGNEYALTSHLAGLHKPLFSDDGKPGFAKDDLGSWYEEWARYRKDGLIPPMKIAAASTGFTTDPLVAGKSAITLAASSKGINGYQPLVEDTLALLSYPRKDADAPTATSVGPIEWFALSSRMDAAKAKRAADLCMEFVNDRTALRTLNLAHGVPLFTSTRDATYSGQSRVNKMLYDNVAELTKQDPAPVAAYPPGATEFLTELGSQNQLIGFGKTSIDRAVARVFDVAQRTLG